MAGVHTLLQSDVEIEKSEHLPFINDLSMNKNLQLWKKGRISNWVFPWVFSNCHVIRGYLHGNWLADTPPSAVAVAGASSHPEINLSLVKKC
jgi:hypothetical protein